MKQYHNCFENYTAS